MVTSRAFLGTSRRQEEDGSSMTEHRDVRCDSLIKIVKFWVQHLYGYLLTTKLAMDRVHMASLIPRHPCVLSTSFRDVYVLWNSKETTLNNQSTKVLIKPDKWTKWFSIKALLPYFFKGWPTNDLEISTLELFQISKLQVTVIRTEWEGSKTSTSEDHLQGSSQLARKHGNHWKFFDPNIAHAKQRSATSTPFTFPNYTTFGMETVCGFVVKLWLLPNFFLFVFFSSFYSPYRKRVFHYSICTFYRMQHGGTIWMYHNSSLRSQK